MHTCRGDMYSSMAFSFCVEAYLVQQREPYRSFRRPPSIFVYTLKPCFFFFCFPLSAVLFFVENRNMFVRLFHTASKWCYGNIFVQFFHTASKWCYGNIFCSVLPYSIKVVCVCVRARSLFTTEGQLSTYHRGTHAVWFRGY